MRLTTDFQRITHKGKAISSKYAGRETSPKADSKKNVYGTIDENGKFKEFESDWKGRCLDLRHCEEDYYTEQFQPAVDYINARYVKEGHKDRIVHKTAKEWLRDPKYAPYRMSLELGTVREHATPEQVIQLTKALTEHIAARYEHIKVMGIAVHLDGELSEQLKRAGFTEATADAHISISSEGVQRTTRKGEPIFDANGNPVYDFDIYKALEMDKVEKWFKDGDGIVKPISDPNIYDKDLLKKVQKSEKYCNTMIGFTQEIREWAFDYCEKEFGLILEREPDERRSRDPYTFQQKSNTRLSTDEYIELDNLRTLIEESKAELEDIKKDAAALDDVTDLEMKVYAKIKKEADKNPKLKGWLDRQMDEQLKADREAQRRGQEMLKNIELYLKQQGADTLVPPEEGPEI